MSGIHLVRQIKRFHQIAVANAMHSMGWRWVRCKRPTNIEKMCEGLPRHQLETLLVLLTRSEPARERSWRLWKNLKAKGG